MAARGPYRTIEVDTVDELRRTVSVLAERVYFALACGRHSTPTGLVKLDERYLTVELRHRSARAVSDALAELHAAGHIILTPGSAVYLTNFLLRFPPPNPNVALRFTRILEREPESPSRLQACEDLAVASKRFRNGSANLPQTQEQEQEQDHQTMCVDAHAREPGRDITAPGVTRVDPSATAANMAAPDPFGSKMSRAVNHEAKGIYAAFVRWMVEFKTVTPGRQPQRRTPWTQRTALHCLTLWERDRDSYRVRGVEIDPTSLAEWESYFERSARQLTWLDSRQELDFYWLTNLSGDKGMASTWLAIETGHGYGAGKAANGTVPVSGGASQEEIEQWMTETESMREPTAQEVEQWRARQAGG